MRWLWGQWQEELHLMDSEQKTRKNNLFFFSVRLSNKADTAPVLFAEGRVEGGAWIHISTVKETVAKLGWPEEHLCDTEKSGALPVPHSHLPSLTYSMAHLYMKILVVLRIPFLKAESQSHAYRQPARVHESRSGVMQLLHTSDEGSRMCSFGLLSLAEVIYFGKSGLSSAFIIARGKSK